MEKLKLCIDVGGTKTAYGLLDDKNQIVYRYQTPTPLEILPAVWLTSLLSVSCGLLAAALLERRESHGR